MGFRPLDGESFSKHRSSRVMTGCGIIPRFRPLDGESFSKRFNIVFEAAYIDSFRPLDGESFSKLWYRWW